MKNKVKLISTLLMIAMIICTISTTCFAGTVDNFVINDGNTQITANMNAKVGDTIKTLRNIAAILAVIVIIVLGIKYMIGSVEEKAEYKKAFIPLIVGIVIVVGAFQIADFIWGFAK